MKTSTKFILAGAATLVAAAGIFGAVQIASAFNQLAAPVKNSISLSSPRPAATKAATTAKLPEAPVDRSALAEKKSGLTSASYAALKSEATAAVSVPAGTSGKVVRDSLLAIAAKYTKPVVLVFQYKCFGGGTGWGISGALYGNTAGLCGSGDSASESSMLAEMDRRAGVEGWTSTDYILIITSGV